MGRSAVGCGLVGLSMLVAAPGRCDEPLSLTGTWTAHVAAARTGGSADIGVSLTFADREYRARLSDWASGTVRLTVVGHFEETTDGSSSRVVFDPTDWTPKTTCRNDVCTGVVPVPRTTAVLHRIDADTITDDAGTTYRRDRTVASLLILPKPWTVPSQPAGRPAPPAGQVDAMPPVVVPPLVLPQPLLPQRGLNLPRILGTPSDPRQAHCLGLDNPLTNLSICAINASWRGCDPVSGYDRDSPTYTNYCICMGHPDGTCG